jgi:long-chain acyl-CoA synthetase
MNKVRSNPVARILFSLAKRIGKVETSKKIFKKVHDRFGGNIKVFLSGGAKLDGQVCRDFWTLGIPTIEGYGLTEMGPLISYNLMDAWKPGSAGRAVRGVDVKIEDGELLAKGPGMMQGYLNKPDATEEIIRDGWVHTGDTGYIDEEGFIFLTGRKSERIVLASGKNLNPEEIEHVILEQSDLIKEIALTERNGRILAYIHPDMDLVRERGIHNLQEAVKWDVIDTYNRKVPEYRRILNFVLTPKELPKTALGKIKRYRLEELLTEGRDPETTKKKAPKLEEYRVLAEYLSRERGKTISPESHLEIDAGLDSLELLELRVFIRKRFGLDLAKDVFLHHPTLVSLSEHISTVRANGQKPAEEEADGTVRNVGDFPMRRPNWLVKGLFLLMSPLLRVLFGIRRFRKYGARFSNPAIIVSNHQSFLDPFILARTLPRRTLMDTYFLAKSRFFRSSLGRYFAERTNSILLDLHEPTESLFNRLMELLEGGKNIVIFPEGTRTFDGKMGSFKKSFAVLSKKLGLPVVPVAINGAYESFPRTKIIPRPRRIDIKYFEPIHPDGKSVQEIVRDVRNTIRGGLS